MKKVHHLRLMCHLRKVDRAALNNNNADNADNDEDDGWREDLDCCNDFEAARRFETLHSCPIADLIGVTIGAENAV